jgi:hypothetical protein
MAVIPVEFTAYPAQFVEVTWPHAVFSVAKTRNETRKRRRIFRTICDFKGETEVKRGRYGILRVCLPQSNFGSPQNYTTPHQGGGSTH